MLSHYRIRSKFKISSDLGANIAPQVLFFKCSSQIYFFQSGNLWTKEKSCLPLPKNYSDGRGQRYKIFRGQVVKRMLGQIQIKRQIIAFYVSYHKEGAQFLVGLCEFWRQYITRLGKMFWLISWCVKPRAGISSAAGPGCNVSNTAPWTIEPGRPFGFGTINGEKRYYMDCETRSMGES